MWFELAAKPAPIPFANAVAPLSGIPKPIPGDSADDFASSAPVVDFTPSPLSVNVSPDF